MQYCACLTLPADAIDSAAAHHRYGLAGSLRNASSSLDVRDRNSAKNGRDLASTTFSRVRRTHKLSKLTRSENDASRILEIDCTRSGYGRRAASVSRRVRSLISSRFHASRSKNPFLTSITHRVPSHESNCVWRLCIHQSSVPVHAAASSSPKM